MQAPKGRDVLDPARTGNSTLPSRLLAPWPAFRHLSLITRHSSLPKLIASPRPVLAPAPRPINRNSRIAPLLFDTNKVRRIIILIRALMKTKDIQFSIRYKFASRPILRMNCAVAQFKDWRSRGRRRAALRLRRLRRVHSQE